MYKCKDCKTLFKEPKFYYEASGEKWACCPCCNNTNFVETKKPNEIEAVELLEMLVYLCAAYNGKSFDRCNCLEYAVDRVRKFISETLNDEDLYNELKSCKSAFSVQQIIEFIYQYYNEKE
jgi:hypothetical protein